MLTAARDAKVKKMVYAASSSTYGDHPLLPKVEDQIGGPLSPYAVTKYVNELYGSVFSKVYGFHTIGLRYFNVFGPKQDPEGPYAAVIPLFMNAVLKSSSATINGDGEQSRDFTFVENAVEANVKALLVPDISSHEVVNIAFGEQTTLNQLWLKINAIAGTALPARHLPERRGDIKHSLASIKKAEKLFGYHPQISLQQGLERTFKWYAGQQGQGPFIP
jgi:UDP-N-acetylglucosamine 4-epimerase